MVQSAKETRQKANIRKKKNLTERLEKTRMRKNIRSDQKGKRVFCLA